MANESYSSAYEHNNTCINAGQGVVSTATKNKCEFHQQLKGTEEQAVTLDQALPVYGV